MSEPENMNKEEPKEDLAGLIDKGKVISSPPPPKEDKQADLPKIDESKKAEPKEDIKFDDFLGVLDKTVPKESVSKVPLKKEGEIIPSVEGKPPDLVKKTLERDLSGIPENLAPLFREMSNDAYEALKPLIKEHAEINEKYENLKAAASQPKSESIFEHERGYVLTPEWEQMGQQLEVTEFVRQHWEDQLSKIEDGKDWQTLELDDKNNIVLGKTELPADPRAKSFVLSNLFEAQASLNNLKSKATDFVRNHKQKYQQDLAILKEANSKYFKQYEDPKHSMKPVLDNILKTLPPVLKRSPFASLVAHLLTNNVELKIVLDRLREQLSGKVSQEELDKKIGPTGDVINSSGPSQGSKHKVTFDDYEKLIHS